jgi:hypothetical protein
MENLMKKMKVSIWKKSCIVFLLFVLSFSISFGFLLKSAVGQELPPMERFDRENSLGVGVMLGEPSGLSVKYLGSEPFALNFGLSYSLGDFFMVSADQLWQIYLDHPITNDWGTLSYFLGGGATAFLAGAEAREERRFFADDDDRFGLGIRVPLGVELFLTDYPLGFTIEVAPGLGVLPSIFSFIQGGVAARYYF